MLEIIHYFFFIFFHFETKCKNMHCLMILFVWCFNVHILIGIFSSFLFSKIINSRIWKTYNPKSHKYIFKYALIDIPVIKIFKILYFVPHNSYSFDLYCTGYVNLFTIFFKEISNFQLNVIVIFKQTHVMDNPVKMEARVLWHRMRKAILAIVTQDMIKLLTAEPVSFHSQSISC